VPLTFTLTSFVVTAYNATQQTTSTAATLVIYQYQYPYQYQLSIMTFAPYQIDYNVKTQRKRWVLVKEVIFKFRIP
jgi:hypothetical protein